MSEILNHPVTYKLVRNFVIGLLLISLASIIINILIAQDAYAIANLTSEVKELSQTVTTQTAQVNTLANPTLLSQKATALGMVISDANTIRMLTVSN